MMNPLTHNQAKALSTFINSIRGDWDTAGILDALGKARDKAPGPDLAIAAIHASQLASNRTPAIIGMDGPHWRATTPDEHHRREPYDPMKCCAICSKREHEHTEWSGHDYRSMAESKAYRVAPPGDLVRNAIHEANGDCCACGTLAIHCPQHREEVSA